MSFASSWKPTVTTPSRLAGQAAVCQAFHATEQRLAFWLAAIRDRVLADDLLLTQEYLASMLGVGAELVTIAARHSAVRADQLSLGPRDDRRPGRPA